ncbi:MAG: (d)CMP kinase [Thermodesulfobacteriota bacterium]|nr:(d)CMP kinase [Thermodesulfobacteriota bacterium]MEE2975724.1 (d)CMP kinase [Thermodesulfobacteriota bacterium]|tara:strand:+ start:605 stop:1270 length:666 start_codon:yes stop_codon:yes gene_type:complete
MLITIDGPSGVGKGTVAKILAESLGYNYLDSGAMYRALALFADLHGVTAEDDSKKLKKILINLHIRFVNEENAQKVFINTDDVTDDIRTNEISKLASQFAVNEIVRNVLKEMQRRLVKNKDYVAEGRDMGTYVFPYAENKFYLDASPEIRARRRALQLKEILGINVNEERVLKEINERDNLDMTRDICPLHPADDAVIINTSDLSINEVMKKIKTIVEQNA